MHFHVSFEDPEVRNFILPYIGSLERWPMLLCYNNVIMRKYLSLIVYGGLFAVPFVPFLVSSSLFFPFITTKVFAWRVIVEVVFAAWVLLALVDPEARPKKSPVLYAIGAFLLLIGLADLLGVAPLKSFWSNFERMEGYISLLHLGAFFLVISSFFREQNWRQWWNTTLAASFVMVGYSVFQLLGVFTINQGGVRVDGTFGNAIYLAVYMLFNIFIALLMMLREWKHTSKRWVYGSLIVLQFIILYFTATRGAILGLLGGLLILAILNVRNKEQVALRRVSVGLIAGMVVVVGGFLAMRNTELVQNSPVLNRFATLNLSELKTQGRYFVWPMAWEGFKDRPILGWGQENFSYVFQEHYRPEMYALEPWFDRAHNIFLDWMVAGGLLGLLAYLSLYATSLYLIWKRGEFSRIEKSVLTALIAAYFFHSFFVFDHLTSYVLFFSLLAYVHSRSATSLLWQATLSENRLKMVALPVVAILLFSTLYFVNWRPLQGNTAVIGALKALQTPGADKQAIEFFEKAYESAHLGRTEVVEQMISGSLPILSGSLSTEEKNAFYAFMKQAVLEQGQSLDNDTRHHLLSGSFYSSVGGLDEALMHLEKAKELMPQKQQIYFEIGEVYIQDKQNAKALAIFKQGYDLAPSNQEAKIIYLIGAIYAGDFSLETRMIKEVGERDYAFDGRILTAYYVNGQIAKVRALLNERKRLDPANTSLYDKYLEEIKNK